jgi:hypothetical protein
MNRRLTAAAIAVLAVAVTSGTGHADERPLIWQPIKNSDTSYSVKLGLKLPTRLEPQAGFDVGMNATKGGKVVDTPLRFWSSIKTDSTTQPGYQMSRDIGVNIDGTVGNAAISMNYFEKQIATPSINIEHRSRYAVRYDGIERDWLGLDASQSVKLRRHETGTAFIASANSADSFSVLGASVGLEQALGQHITLSGNVNRNFTEDATTTRVNANYSYRW